MREITLATRVSNKEIIDFLHINLKNQFDFCKTIITNYCDNNFCYILFACEDEFYLACEEIIKTVIVDYIESVYKVNYLKSKIKNPICDTLGFGAYIKVLSIFDRPTDENMLKDIIMLNQAFFVDSFIKFRLEPLRRHWNNLIEVSADNISMFNSGTFIDIIKFLINTMDNGIYKVKVIFNGEKFSIYNIKTKNDKVKKIAECQSALDLITNVLSSCPSYVDIYLDTSQDNEAVNFLSSIYANRLKIFSK